MISRRTFLASAGIVLPAAAAGAGWQLFDYRSLVRSALHARLHFLELEPDGVDRFVDDFISEYQKSHLRVGTIHSVHFLDRQIGSLNLLKDRLRSFEELVCTIFLRGSDFFAAGEDAKNKLVHYRFFPDPYKVPCANPFAQFT